MSISLHKLNNIISRLENLEEQKTHIMDDFKDIMNEAKNDGFDVKILRKVLKVRKMKPEELSEEEELLHLYLKTLQSSGA